MIIMALAYNVSRQSESRAWSPSASSGTRRRGSTTSRVYRSRCGMFSRSYSNDLREASTTIPGSVYLYGDSKFASTSAFVDGNGTCDPAYGSLTRLIR